MVKTDKKSKKKKSKIALHFVWCKKMVRKETLFLEAAAELNRGQECL